MSEKEEKFGKYAVVLLVVGALGRILWITLQHPDWNGPTLGDGYIDGARDILRLNFRALGDRTPVYPLLVALCGVSRRAIWVAQSILGVTSSLMIFDMAFRRTRHACFSLLVGLVCSLTPEVFLYEAWFMTEALTNFLLVTSIWLITRCDAAGESDIRYPLSLGSIVALAGLTRPMMICLVPVYYCFLVPLWPPGRVLQRKAIRTTLLFALPPVVLIFGWCGFNYFNSGFFTPTTRAGEHLMAQVDPYVDLAPEQFAPLRDAWVRSRLQNKVTSDTNTDVYYGALAELEKRTGKTEIQISHEYGSLALYLEIHHPLLCLRRAELGWFQFWGEPSEEEVEWRQGGRTRLTEFVVAMTKFLSREVEAVFLILALLSIPCVLFRLKVFTRVENLIFAIALLSSAFAAFTEFGENRRYCVPLYMLMIYTVFTRGWIWIAATLSKGSGRTSAP